MSAQQGLAITSLVLLCIIALVTIVRKIPGMTKIGQMQNESSVMKFFFYLSVFFLSIALVIDQEAFKPRPKHKIPSKPISKERPRSRSTRRPIPRRTIRRSNSATRSSKDINIYTMKGCTYCDKMKENKEHLENALPDYNINFLDKSDPTADKLGITGFPTSVVNGQHIRGFMDPSKFAEKVKALN